jgi:hypothetical protein
MRQVHHSGVINTQHLIAMIRTRSLCQHEACIVAVSALDDLVAQLVKTCHLKLPPLFLDGVAEAPTPLVEQQIADCFGHPLFAASLRQGDPRLVLASWMREWLRPGLTARFAALLPHLPPADRRLPVLLPAHAVQAVPVLPAARPRMPAGLALPA